MTPKSPQDLNDDELIAVMERCFGAAPPSLNDPEIRALTLPVLRADLALLASYQWKSATPINCPLTVYAGKKHKTMKGDEVDEFAGERGRRGRKLPRGYQKVDRIEVLVKE